MLIRNFIEPLPIRAPEDTLASVLDWLRVGAPVAFRDPGDDWRVLMPIDVLEFPTTRQLCDLPSHSLATVPIDEEIELARMCTQDVWGAVRGEALVGRVDSHRVLGELGKLADTDSDTALAAAARERLMPRFLHNMSNALAVAMMSGGVGTARLPTPAAQALRHAAALTEQMRDFYADRPPAPPAEIDLAALIERVEPMLSLAAHPATLRVRRARGAVILAEAWRIESVLLNLVLNAADRGTTVELHLHAARAGDVALSVEDDGPGFDGTPGIEHAGRYVRGHGLASVRRQVAILGGRLELGESPSLGGARVRLVIPLTAPAPSA